MLFCQLRPASNAFDPRVVREWQATGAKGRFYKVTKIMMPYAVFTESSILENVVYSETKDRRSEIRLNTCNREEATD